MTAVRKFLFDTSFDPGRPEPAQACEAAPEAAAEPAALSFSEEELAAARQQGYAEGREAAAQEAMASVEQRIADSLQSANLQIADLLSDQAAAAETRRAIAMRLALKLVETIFPSLQDGTRMMEIEAAIDTVLRQLEDEPRVVVRAPDDLVDTLGERLSDITGSAGFRGQVVLLPDGDLNQSAVRVEWASGGAERDSARIWQDLRGAVEAYVAHLPETQPAVMGDTPETADGD